MKKMKLLLIILTVISTIFCFNSSVAAQDTPNASYMKTGSYVSCGTPTPLIKKIPSIIPKISKSIYNIVMVIVPLLLVFFGMIDLVKGVMSQKEDEIKKGRDNFVKRLIIGLVLFLIVMLTKMFVGIFSSSDSSRIVECIDCFISNECSADS